MKKPSSALLYIFLLCFTLLCATPQRAEAASATFSGSGSLRAGDTVAVTFSVSGSDVSYIEVSLSYDSNTLEYRGSQKIIQSGKWDMQENNGKFQLEDVSQSSPINSSTQVFSVTFRVKSNVSAGSTVSASISGYVSNMSGDSNVSGSWSAKILAPLSGDAELDDLWCDNATLNFTGGTEYSITVPYSVSSLDLDWSRSHSGSSVSVSGNSLSVGSNTVTITVEAENGNTKRYYIYVTREQDPNYVPSTDATISSLSVSTGTLSPSFSTDVTDYVVYIPYEVTKLEISAVANDSKAKGVSQTRKVLLPEELPTDDAATDGTADKAGTTADSETPEPQYNILSADDLLPEGETIYTITCTAEDGTTTKDYTIHVIRMPLFAGVLPEIIPPVTEPVEPTEPEPEPEPTTYDLSLPLVLTLPLVGEVTLQQAALGTLIALGILLLILLLVAWAIGRRGGKRKALRQLAKANSQPDAPTEALLDRLAAEEADEAPAVPVEEVSAAALSAEAAAQADETPCAEEPSADAEEAPTEDQNIAEEASVEEVPSCEETPAPEEPVGETDSPCEEAVAAAAVLSAAELTVEEPADDVPTQETPDQPAEPEEPAEEPSTEPSEEEADAAPSSEQPVGTPDELAGMSLDELLEDIRNM